MSCKNDGTKKTTPNISFAQAGLRNKAIGICNSDRALVIWP